MKPHKTFIAQAIAIALTATASNTYAEEGFTLEEIVVTAQKRAESLQDVPISVNAVAGEFLENSGISNLEEMSAHVPNLNISNTPGANQIVMRGLGSGASADSFEQSVGLYVDGIYSARSRQFQVPFMDVERVEVLRGPQGVLFGKNSIAGAVSVISAKPTEEFEAEITGKYELEYGSYEVDTMVSGELTEGLYGRLAIKSADKGGYLDNEALNEDQPEEDTEAVRGVLVWDATDETQVTLKLETAEFEQEGTSFQISDYDASASAPLDPVRAGLQALYQGALATSGDDFELNDEIHSDQLSTTEIESDNVTLEVKHALDEYELTYLFGYSSYDMESASDQDFTDIDFMFVTASEEYDQVSHEIRLASPVGETFEYMLGAYYIDRELERPLTERYLDLSVFPGAGFVPLPAPFAAFSVADLSHNQVNSYTEDADSWSVFFQGTWNITDEVRATLGARYSEETKEARGIYQSTVVGDSSTAHPLANSFLIGLGIADSDLERKRTEENLDPSFNMQWDFSADGMAYFSWTKATKAGGFNSSHNTPDENNFEYEEEQAESFEIGVKLDLLDGRGRLNAAYFNTEFDDLQVSSFDGTNFVTGNAAKAKSQGVEVEAMLALTEEWTIGSNFAWLNAEYDEFQGPCTSNVDEWGADCTASLGASQDLSGKSLEFAPEWSGNLFADYQTNLSDNLIFSARVDANYSDDYTLQPDQDSHNMQDSFWKVNLRVALSSADERWTVALLGTNLTDEETKSFGGAQLFIPGAYWANIAPPRQVQLSATYRFGK
ncbi:TonB-dependent receptor [Maricurvus nonylphenolicus]|uniref:TonB-dependent receptor n=1 Tax=Maricurvus nonylphenolicus TaxID=1008307 RepID=UPI0036F2DCE3